MLELQPRQQSAYRSVRYSTIRKQTNTADSQRPFFSRPKGKTAMTSTFYHTRTLDLQPQRNSSRIQQYRKAPYFDTFQSMIQSERAVKEDPQAYKTNDLKVKFINFDEEFIKPDSTEFTLLDPFKRPYTYLTKQTEKCQAELNRQQEEVKMLRYELGKLKKEVANSLQSSEDQGCTAINRLRNILRKNQTNQQQRKMRVRRELTELYTHHDHNCEMGDSLISRTQMMQRGIFSCEPFQLQVSVGQ